MLNDTITCVITHLAYYHGNKLASDYLHWGTQQILPKLPTSADVKQKVMEVVIEEEIKSCSSQTL